MRRSVVEKSSPSGDPRSTRAIASSDSRSRNPAVWTGFFVVPSPAHPQRRWTNELNLKPQLQGLWLPLVTPFRDGELDEASLRRLVRHYASGPVDGFILAATSGEGLTLASPNSSDW